MMIEASGWLVMCKVGINQDESQTLERRVWLTGKSKETFPKCFWCWQVLWGDNLHLVTKESFTGSNLSDSYCRISSTEEFHHTSISFIFFLKTKLARDWPSSENWKGVNKGYYCIWRKTFLSSNFKWLTVEICLASNHLRIPGKVYAVVYVVLSIHMVW